jgi:predicted dehydrogenase
MRLPFHFNLIKKVFCVLLIVSCNTLYAQQPLHVAVAGLSHDHIYNVLQQNKNKEVVIIGIAESNQELVTKYKKLYNLPDSIFYTSLDIMLHHVKPDAVLAYDPIAEHVSVVEICAPKHIAVMVEKPLATTAKDALHIAALAAKYNVQVLTNYETTWYNTNQQIKEMVDADSIGSIRKMIVHDGHQGPKEIGCSKEFLQWLTDSIKNGGGAIRDFGCYGANLMTWLMNGKAPVAVTAITHQIKPSLYPNVDDDATILLDYSNATGIIEASWNWPFGIKDMEVFGVSGYLHALNANKLQQRTKDVYQDVAVKPAMYADNIQYLADVLRGKINAVNDLSSLANNVIVVRILEAASKSAREGRKIILE